MKIVHVLLIPLICLGLNVACDTRTPAQTYKAGSLEKELKWAEAGDLVVYKRDDDGADDYHKVSIVKRIVGGEIWFEGASEGQDSGRVANEIERIVKVYDPTWTKTLQGYYKAYQKKYSMPAEE